MNISQFFAVFVVILFGEIPDKTFIANVIMSTKHNALGVFIGSTTAFIIHVVIAVAAGSLIANLPKKPVDIVVAMAFAGGAIYLLLTKESTEIKEGEEEAGHLNNTTLSFNKVALTSFGIIFIGEWGDLTQILMANMSAKYHSWFTVGTASLLGLVGALLLAILFGKIIMKYVPMEWFRKGAGIVILGMAVISSINAFHAK